MARRIRGAHPKYIVLDDPIRAGYVKITVDGETFGATNLSWTDPETEMDEFAMEFQAFIGADPRANLPEGLKELGIHRCREKMPCYVRNPDGGERCPCLARKQRWEAFWRLVRYDQEDRLPSPLKDTTVDQYGLPMHRPVFTFVCPACRTSRSDSYKMGWGADHLPALTPAKGEEWLGVTSFVRPIDVIRRHVASTILEHYVCSAGCAEVISKESDKWEAGRLESIWSRLDTTATPGEIELLGVAYGIERDPTIKRYEEGIIDIRNRLRVFQAEQARKHDRERRAQSKERVQNKRVALQMLKDEALEKVARDGHGIERWAGEDDEALRRRILAWSRNKTTF